MSDTPLATRLRLKPSDRVLLLNAPSGYAELLCPLPEGATISEEPGGSFDVAQLFVRNVAELERLAPVAISAVPRDGRLWISYPKRSAKVPTDITRDTGWDAVDRAGLRGVTQISVDETWSALRFRPVDAVKPRSKQRA